MPAWCARGAPTPTVPETQRSDVAALRPTPRALQCSTGGRIPMTDALVAAVRTELAAYAACEDKAGRAEVKPRLHAALHGLLAHVSESMVPDAERTAIDAMLVDEVIGVEHWGLLRALQVVGLYHAFLGLPQTMEQVRRKLATVSTAKVCDMGWGARCSGFVLLFPNLFILLFIYLFDYIYYIYTTCQIRYHSHATVALCSSEPLIPRGHLEYCEVSRLRQLTFGLNQKKKI